MRQPIEGRGCELVYPPPYSSNSNPMEQAYVKVKGQVRKAAARTREGLVETMGSALVAVTARDARDFFEHCEYRVVAQQLRQTF